MSIRQLLTHGAVIVAFFGLLLATPNTALHAQDDPQQEIARLALEVHMQNLRAGNYTDWIGGKLGAAEAWNETTAVGMNLADQTLSGFLGDPDFDFSQLKRPVLVNLWASWCGPCRLEMPHLVNVALAPDEHNFDVLFVNTWDDPEAAEALLNDFPDAIVTTLDEDNQFSDHVHLVGLPSSLLVDTDGTVVMVYIGPMTRTAITFMDAVAANPGIGSFDANAYADVEPRPALAPVTLEDATPLAFGETVNDAITDETYQHVYRFSGRAGDVVHIEMHAEPPEDDGFGLDTSIFLMNADGEILDENDDAPNMGTDSALTFTLPEDGDYIIVATRFLERDGFDSGAYTLSLERGEDSSPATRKRPPAQNYLGRVRLPASEASGTPQQGGEASPIAYGETVSGEITDEHYEQRWAFEGTQGDVVTIAMERAGDESGALDGYLLLLGPDGETLTEVDDANESVMPTIAQYALPQDGAYTIVATRFGFADGFSSGAYTLTLTREAGGQMSAVSGATRWFHTTLPAAHWVEQAANVEGHLDDAHYEDWYVFQGTASDVLTVRMTAIQGDLDPYLILTNAAGYEIASRDDISPHRSEAGLAQVTLPEDGLYFIRATRYGFQHGVTAGNYRLELSVESSSATRDGVGLPALAYGESAQGELSLGHPSDRYAFNGRAGERITAAVLRRSGDLAPRLTLQGPDGQTLAVSTVGFDADEVRIAHLELPTDGLYTLDVRPENLNTSGAYQLLLLGGTSPSLNAGAFTPAPNLDLEVVLIWATEADLELSLTTTDGTPVGIQTAHANDLCETRTTTPVERVAAENGALQSGVYRVSVRYRFDCASAAAPVDYLLGVAVRGQVVDVISGTLPREGDALQTWVVVP